MSRTDVQRNSIQEQMFTWHTNGMAAAAQNVGLTGRDGASDADPGHFSPSVLYAAAKMYYTEDATQAEVAAQLGTSRTTVSRLLAEAKRQGIVRIEVVPPQEAASGDRADRLAP